MTYIDIAVQHGLEVLWWDLWDLVDEIHQKTANSVVSRHFTRLDTKQERIFHACREKKRSYGASCFWTNNGRLTSTSSAYCSTVLRVSWILADAAPTCCRSLDKLITRLGLKQVFMTRSTRVQRGGKNHWQNRCGYLSFWTGTPAIIEQLHCTSLHCPLPSRNSATAITQDATWQHLELRMLMV